MDLDTADICPWGEMENWFPMAKNQNQKYVMELRADCRVNSTAGDSVVSHPFLVRCHLTTGIAAK